MRKELFYNPGLLIERIAESFAKRRRLAKLKNTVASELAEVHITSMEFLELARKNSNNSISTIYDLGGNIGTWTQLAKAVIPQAAVHGFEPIPQYQEAYAKTTAGINNVTLHKVGVGSDNKKEKFNFAAHSSSFLEVSENLTNMFPSQKKTNEFVVDMVRLDDYVKTNNLPYPDLMKLDVEGYELEVLKGAVNCMENCQYIVLEVSFIERHIGQPLFHEVVYFMAQHNYFLYSFPEKMHLAQKIYMTDVLFENKKFAHKITKVSA